VDIRGTGEQEFLPRICTNYTNFLDADFAEEYSHRALSPWDSLRRGHREVCFTGRGVNGLVYTNSQPYSKRACAFGLRSLSKLLTLSALVKPEKSLFF